ncbi:MAG: hypothetical protein JWM57_1699, partial [Phycisphaerales bacterium]|nr:hypothetical protein [Phycisphaerales bacterium]
SPYTISTDAAFDTLTVGSTDIGEINQTGGAVFANLGPTLGTTATGNGTYQLSAGSLNTNLGMTIGAAGTGTFILAGGSLNTQYNPMKIAWAAGSSGTLILRGGRLTTESIVGGAGTSIVIADGATIEEIAGQQKLFTGLTAVRLSGGGLTIETSAFDPYIGQVLSHDPALGAAADGGLTMTHHNASVGSLTLAAANTYTGPTTLAGGYLHVANNNALGVGGAIRFTGGTLVYNSGFTPDFSSRFSAEANQSINIDTNYQTITFAGNIGGVGTSLNKLNYGTLILKGVNTYTGGTTVAHDSTLVAAKAASLPGYDQPGKVVLNAYATLALAAGGWSGSEVTALSDSLTLATGATLALDVASGVSSSIGNLGGVTRYTKTGSGMLTLTDTNTFTGGINISTGIVSATSPAALPGYNVPGRVNVNNSSTLAVRVGGLGEWTDADIATLRASAFFSTAGYFGIDTTDAPSGYTLTAPIKGPSGLSKVGPNTLKVNTALTYTGLTAVTGGTLAVQSGGQLGGGTVTIGRGAALAVSGSGNIALAPNANLVLNGTGNPFATCTVADSAAVTAANVFVGGDGSFGSGGAGDLVQTGGSITATAALIVGNGFSGNGTYTLSGGSLSAQSMIVANGGYATVSQGGGAVTLTGALTVGTIQAGTFGSGGLGGYVQSGGSVRAGTGLAIGAGVNSSGTYQLLGGTLSVPKISQPAGTSATGYFFFNGGTLKPTASTATFMTGLSYAHIGAGGAMIDTSGFNVTISQLLLQYNPGTADGGLTKLGVGQLTLTGSNTYAGATVIRGGAIIANAAATAPILSGSGGLDLASPWTGIVFDYTGGSSPLATILPILQAGYGEPVRFAEGQIRSSAAGGGLGIGYRDNGVNAVTLLATLYGDADLDGKVDFNDFLALQNGFNQPGAFSDGDFNYDGLVDFNDFLALQNNFGQSVNGVSATITRQEVAAMTAFASAVPEPGSFASLALAGLTLLRRRRALA